jgi:protein involved in polysaccharide export with SLBB domain
MSHLLPSGVINFGVPGFLVQKAAMSLISIWALSVAVGTAVAQPMPNALRPGDIVRLRVYREPDLSGDFPLNERGVVTLPRMGEIPISQWPADSIGPRITHALAEFLRDPVVEVTLLRRIAIYGFVMKPGLYPVDPTMTVNEALALAGGAAPDGMKDQVDLIRDNQRIMTDLARSTTLNQANLQSGDQLFVPQMSWWARNGRLLVPSLIGAAATLVAVWHR